MRWIVGSLLVVVLGLGSACSDSSESGSGAPSEGATIAPRPIPEIWADILTQRDRISIAIAKGTDMWHEDCAEVSAASAVLDKLAVELNQRVALEASVEDRRKGIENLIGYLQTTATTIRSTAIDEIVGALPSMMIGLDALLQGIENHFKREEIGNESVLTRPGFNPVRPPPPPSPI